MNPAKNKRMGYEFEVDSVGFLIDEYPEAERNGNRYGNKDRGDIGGIPGWTLQCKNVKTDQWAKWFVATAKQAVHNSSRWWAVVRKARGHNVREALFVMPFWQGKELMIHLRDLETENEALKARIKELEA